MPGMKVVGGVEYEPKRKQAPRSKPKKLSVTQAASSGDARALLVAMRDRVARAVESEETPARDLASLTKRLMDITRDIQSMDEQTGVGVPVDAGDEEFDPSTI